MMPARVHGPILACVLLIAGCAGGRPLMPTPNLYTDGKARCCQSNANRSPKSARSGLSGRKLTPFGQSGRSVLLEDIAAVYTKEDAVNLTKADHG